jgi:hypothetical protein
MPTFEQRAIQEELDLIDDPADLRDVLYLYGNKFYTFNLAGYRLRFERRKARASDWRVGFLAILVAGLLSLGFVVDQSIVSAFTNSAPYIWTFSIIGMAFAAWRRIRVSDWFLLLYLASYLAAASIVVPATLVGENNMFPLLAAGLLFSVSLALFLNISMLFYVAQLNLASLKRPRYHFVGA